MNIATTIEKIDFSEIVKLYKSEEEFYRKAYFALSLVNPEVKRDFAILLYKEEKVSFEKAFTIAGMSIIEFKELLALKGIEKRIYLGTEEENKRSRKYLEEFFAE